jgi:acyl-coenzyme A synthetase/AMP-(fatty) acid ligase
LKNEKNIPSTGTNSRFELRSFYEDYQHIVLANSTRTAFHDNCSEKALTYEQLDTVVDQLYARLVKGGVKPGGIVTSCLADGLLNTLTFLCCGKYGLSFMPVSTQSTPSEIERQFNLVTPSCLVGQAGTAFPEVPKAVNKTAIPKIELDLATVLQPTPTAVASVHRLNDESGHLYIFTSGSTGTPKCLKIHLDRLWSAACAFSRFHDFLDASAVFFNFYPMSYLAGLFNLTLIPFSMGASVVIDEGFAGLKLMRFWAVIKRYSVDVLWLSPTVIHALAQRATGDAPICPIDIARNIRASFLGMSPISTEKKIAYEKALGFPLLENYALSETTFISSETLSNRFRRQPGYVGDLLPWVEARLSTSGELEVKTPYLCESVISQEAKGIVETPLNAGDFWATGDLTEIQDKRLYFKGRRKNIIKKGGYLVGLDEVENVTQQVSSLGIFSVVGIEHGFHGECAVLCLQTSDEARLGEIRKVCATQLSRYKWPSYVMTLDAIPLTTSGKPDRVALTKLATERLAKNEITPF